MNIVFIGSSRFGLRCLDTILRTSGCKVTGVVTAHHTFSISYRPEGVKNVLHADIQSYARARGIPVCTLTRGMMDVGLLEEVSGWKPGAFVVAGWYHMVPKAWRRVAPAYGLHASLLPDYSGGAPLVWALINGERKTGITLFQMDDGVDTGPIVDQAEEHIYDEDTIATLYSRIEQRGLELLAACLPSLADGTATLRPQPTSGRRVMPQRGPEDGKIDWTAGAAYLGRFIRAQTRPYPGAFSMFGGIRTTVWAARDMVCNTRGRAVGSVFFQDNTARVVCGDGAVILDEIEVGGGTYEGRDVVNAPNMNVGSDNHKSKRI